MQRVEEKGYIERNETNILCSDCDKKMDGVACPGLLCGSTWLTLITLASAQLTKKAISQMHRHTHSVLQLCNLDPPRLIAVATVY